MSPGVRFPVLAVAAVCLLLTLAPCSSASGQGLPERLWSRAELAARPGEEKPGRRTAPDFAAPAKALPARPLDALPPHLRGSIRRVDTGGARLVALTFDLCQLADQRSGYDGAIVDVLRREGVAATFFASGSWLRSHPERAMQLAADPLFELGNHAWTHGNFGRLDPERMRQQILWTQAQYETTVSELAALAAARARPEIMERVPPAIRAFRFPYGRCRPEALELLADLGLAAVQWDVNLMDAAPGRTAQAMARDCLRAVRPGSIVLGHANGFGRQTAQALEIVIPALRAQGYGFVTVSRMLASGRTQTTPECFDSRPGDTAVYDSIFGDGVTHPDRRK